MLFCRSFLCISIGRADQINTVYEKQIYIPTCRYLVWYAKVWIYFETVIGRIVSSLNMVIISVTCN